MVEYVIARIGHSYDMKNIIDLLRHFIRTPPTLHRWKRKLITLGSGDPTRTICSALIAEAFQSVHYPILPDVSVKRPKDQVCGECYEEVLHDRHSSLVTPRDFDVSPYFRIIKPTIDHEFDPHRLRWENQPEAMLTREGHQRRLATNESWRETLSQNTL